MLNGIDVGFGYTKAVAENGRSVSFPSAVLPEAQGESDLTRVLGSGEGDHRLEMRDDPDGPPKAFRVGYDALAMGAVRTWDTNASERSDYVLLALTAARLLACAGPVHLAVGVPLSLYLPRRRLGSKIRAHRCRFPILTKMDPQCRRRPLHCQAIFQRNGR